MWNKKKAIVYAVGVALGASIICGLLTGDTDNIPLTFIFLFFVNVLMLKYRVIKVKGINQN